MTEGGQKHSPQKSDSTLPSGYFTGYLIPSVLSDQLYNVSVVGLFLIYRKRLLMKCYAENSFPARARLILNYERKTGIRTAVDYWEKTAKLVLLMSVGVGACRILEERCQVDRAVRYEEILKPILFLGAFSLSPLYGLVLGLLNFGIKCTAFTIFKEYL